MKKLNTLLVLLFFCLFTTTIFAQDRYMNPVFTDVQVTKDVTYGANFTILSIPATGHTALQPLQMDVYEPMNDSITERPLVVYLHAGHFLPTSLSGSTSGTRGDSSVVEMATRLAKLGYVVAVADYRTGWDPISTDQNIRTNTFVNAIYRGMQDTRTCVRYFRKDFSEDNVFGIDTSKITVWGEGSGGYIALATSSVDAYSELVISKYIDGNTGLPMVVEAINGNIDGTSFGFVPIGFGTPYDGDTLSIPNHIGYSSDVHFCVNLGGAIGDLSWIDAGEAPIISYQVPSDPVTPYKTDFVTVPFYNDTITVVSGAYAIQEKVNALGNNNIIKNSNIADPVTDVANSINNGKEGLYPFSRSTVPGLGAEFAPWEWWDTAYWGGIQHPNCPPTVPAANCNVNDVNLYNNPTMSATKANTYIDTIMRYFTSRACVVLDLPCKTNVGTEQLLVNQDINILLAPNPARTNINLDANESIEAVLLFDLNGRLVYSQANINQFQYQIPRRGLPSGMYIVKIKFKDGVVGRKVIFD